MYREAKTQHEGDPVRAWAHIVDNPLRAKRYKTARGKGGLVRASWEEATEMIAATHVHTIKKWGTRPSRRVLPHPGDVDGVARLRCQVPQPDRRLHVELL